MSGMYTQTPAPGASGKFTNSEKLPSPRSGYGSTEIPDLWSAPVQGITIFESSQLSSVSQLGRSHPVSPLRSQISLAQSRDCANVLRNLEIVQTYCTISRLSAQSQDWMHNPEIDAQFPDSKNAQRNLKIAQIPKLHGTSPWLCMEVTPATKVWGLPIRVLHSVSKQKVQPFKLLVIIRLSFHSSPQVCSWPWSYLDGWCHVSRKRVLHSGLSTSRFRREQLCPYWRCRCSVPV